MAETKKKNENTGALPIGYVLNGGKYAYRIVEVLGQGGYGITYKAMAKIPFGNITAKVLFAIKENFAKDYCGRAKDGATMTYPSEREEEAKRDLKEFLDEGNLLKKICKENRHIVDVNETFEANNTAYYVMQYIEGGDLRKQEKRMLTEEEALAIITPIADAVNCMHQHKRLHLDIKPENIMLQKPDDDPILIDFGVSLHFTQSGERSQTSKDKATGFSDRYAPMEQHLGIDTFSPETDVYSLAATLYFLLVGEDPDRASDVTPRRIESKLPPTVSGHVRKAIANAMNPLKSERTQTIKQFLEELTTMKPAPKKQWSEEHRASATREKEAEKKNIATKVIHTPHIEENNSIDEEEYEAGDDWKAKYSSYIVIAAVLALIVVSFKLIGSCSSESDKTETLLLEETTIDSLANMSEEMEVSTSNKDEKYNTATDGKKGNTPSNVTTQAKQDVQVGNSQNKIPATSIEDSVQAIIAAMESEQSFNAADEMMSTSNSDAAIARPNSSTGNSGTRVEVQTGNQPVFQVVDEMPQFPGGDAAMMQYLANNIKYPIVAEELGIQGRVLCTFVIERNGSISDVRVVKSVDPSLDKEAVRVIKSMPAWTPGKQNGSAVRVKYTMPLTFRLQ